MAMCRSVCPSIRLLSGRLCMHTCLHTNRPPYVCSHIPTYMHACRWISEIDDVPECLRVEELQDAPDPQVPLSLQQRLGLLMGLPGRVLEVQPDPKP